MITVTRTAHDRATCSACARPRAPHLAAPARGVGLETKNALREALWMHAGSMDFDEVAELLVTRHGVPVGSVHALVTSDGFRVEAGRVSVAYGY